MTKKIGLLALSLCIQFTCIAQVDPFGEYVRTSAAAFNRYKDNAADSFNRYRDSLNNEFAEYLANTWEKFRPDEGISRPQEPKPAKVPEVKPGTVPPAVNKLPVEEYTKPMKPAPILQAQPTPQIKPEPPAKPVPQAKPAQPALSKNYVKTEMTFFGVNTDFAVAPQINNIELKGINEKDIAGFWQELATCDYQNLMSQYEQAKRNRQLNDYAFYRYILQSAQTLFPGSGNRQIVYSVFMLNQFGYKAKIGKADNRLVCLLAIPQQLYSISYLTINSDRYYIFDGSPNRKTASFGSVYTYRDFMKGCIHPFDMNIYQPMKLGNDKQICTIHNDIFGDMELAVDKNIIDFYKSYPQVELQVYADAGMNAAVLKQIAGYLKPQLEGLSETEAANRLLAFMHRSFKYKTDREQFGYEKPMFCEETFFYPYSDCEDNAILFSCLVRSLLNLETVLIDYPGHVAAAVCFNEDAGGTYVAVDGKRFVVCDPTYMGASIGMAMPQYASTPVKIILLRGL